MTDNLDKHYEVQEVIKEKVTDLQVKMDNHLDHEHTKLDDRLGTIDSAISGMKKRLDKIDPASQKFVAVVGAISMIVYLVIILITK